MPNIWRAIPGTNLDNRFMASHPTLFRRLLNRIAFVRLSGPAGTQVGLLIRQAALKEWPLLAVNISSNLLLALSEGLTFVVIFQASQLLNGSKSPGLSSGSGLLAPLGQVLQNLDRGQQFLLLLLGAVGLQTLMSLARYVNGLSIGWFAARCQRMITPAMHRHLLSLSYGCASRYSIGHLINVVGRAPQTVQVQIVEAELVISNLLLVSVYLVALNPSLSLVAILLAFVIAGVQHFLRPRIRSAARKQIEAYRVLAVRMTEDIQLLRLLHSSAGLENSAQRITQGVRELEQHMVRLTWWVQLLEPISDLLPVIAAVVIGILSWLMFRGNGALLVPNLITFVLVIQRLNLRLSRLGSGLNRLAENSVALQEVEEILDPSDKQFRRQGGLPFSVLSRVICFAQVSLIYPDRIKPSLCNINFRITKGSKVALVGESGAGKSSIVDLLVGLIAPTRGSIMVDGVNLDSMNLDDWQQALGVVSQDVLLMNGSVRDNIALVLPGASFDQIRAASRAADVESFILNLPDQYDTIIGERGFRLSGGQRQRLSLARALLKQPQLLILDEATSALDSLSEARILATLDKVAQSMTVLSVAHRLSSVSHADEILVLDQGHIVERGNHAELMRLGGFYAALWNRQACQSSQTSEGQGWNRFPRSE
jgi:subfamily B ATP-binding cassette protein MsbA